MSVPSQQGIFGWANSSDKDNLPTDPALWYRAKATEISFGSIQDLRTFPPEVGGELTPTGAYKNGVYGGGGVTLQPRIEEVFGHLLKAMLGTATESPTGTITVGGVVAAGDPSATGLLTLAGNPPTTRPLAITTADLDALSTFDLLIAGTDVTDAVITEFMHIIANGVRQTAQAFKTVTSANVVTAAVEAAGAAVSVNIGWFTAGPYTHTFKMATDQSSIGWLALRKWIPGPTIAESFGEVLTGCRVTGARLTIPASGIVSARMEFQGRIPSYAKNPGWDQDSAWSATMEDTGSVPLASAINGAVELPTGTPAKVTSLIVNWANNVSTPEQERIVGTPYLDDIIALSRAMSLQATIKWQDADLFAKIYTGADAAGAAAAGWVAKPFTTTFLASILAPDDIPGHAGVKYQLDVNADQVMWNCNGPITLAGADLVMMPIIGTVIRQRAGHDYASFGLKNNRATAY